MVGKHYNCSFSFFPLSLKGKLDRNMGLSRERGHERGLKQLGFFFFFCTQTRQTFRAMWRGISLRLNAMIFYLFKDIFQ